MRNIWVILLSLVLHQLISAPAFAAEVEPGLDCQSMDSASKWIGDLKLKSYASWRDADKGHERGIWVHEPSQTWLTASAIPQDGKLAYCLTMKGKSWGRPAPAQRESLFGKYKISCPDQMKLLREKTVTFPPGGEQVTAGLAYDALTSSLMKIDALGRDNGWSLAKIEQQKTALRRMRDVYGVKPESWCAKGVSIRLLDALSGLSLWPDNDFQIEDYLGKITGHLDSPI